MREDEIARDKVLPHILKSIKWPANLVTDYGRVPVQAGTSTYWADFVCYYIRHRRPQAYLTVEVKTPNENLDDAIAQTEFYSILLGSPFFCVTNGDDYRFFLCGRIAGGSVRLDSRPAIPQRQLLPIDRTFAQLIELPASLDPMIDQFFAQLDINKELLLDTKWHADALKYWNTNIFAHLRTIGPNELSLAIAKNTVRSRNTSRLAEYARTEFDRFKEVLKAVRNISPDPLVSVRDLLDPRNKLHIPGASTFFISQLLASAYPKDFGVLHDDIGTILSKLGLTDVPIKGGTANAYLYANDMCKRIYAEKLEQRIRESNYGFAEGFEFAVAHNFLWHYHRYLETGKWC